MEVKVGTCGYSYMNPRDFFGEGWRERYGSILQAYAALFQVCELNSTFYRTPRLSTVERWRREVDKVNEQFEFTVKASQQITHKIRFSRDSISSYNQMREACERLNAKILVFQTPPSFNATEENVDRMRDFFDKVDRGELTFVWEMRGDWHQKPKLIEGVCRMFGLIPCVDPFRNEPVNLKDEIAYFRLHGLGKESMYRYNFSAEELNWLKKKIEELYSTVNMVYLMFNNSECYSNAMQYMKLN
ncbi:MAG: DUF72 domain-containing protein [Nitrososphaeria archaeon]